jgi:hypothetical protein
MFRLTRRAKFPLPHLIKGNWGGILSGHARSHDGKSNQDWLCFMRPELWKPLPPPEARIMSGGLMVIKADRPKKAGALTNRIRDYGFNHQKEES